MGKADASFVGGDVDAPTLLRATQADFAGLGLNRASNRIRLTEALRIEEVHEIARGNATWIETK